MSFNTDDTICAIATAPGGAARGVVRVSGRNAVQIATSLFEAAGETIAQGVAAPSAVTGQARLPIGDLSRTLPCDLLVWPTNRSYTREPVAEFHTIGSPPILSALLGAVCAAGARLAEPGEFTLRAFLAGRLDLTRAEAVLGVIDARGSEDLATSLSQLAGGLARPLDGVRDELLQLLAELEAGLDFVDEDIEFISADELQRRLDSAETLLEAVSEQMSSRHISNDRTQIVLIGAPNAGKSSLFNAMVSQFGGDSGRHSEIVKSALVSPIHGTTRDYLTAPISLNGIECELVDTAGIDVGSDRAASDLQVRQLSPSIDESAQWFTRERRKNATIRVCCIDTSHPADEGCAFDLQPPSELSEFDLIAFTKLDKSASAFARAGSTNGIPAICTSSRTGEGLNELCEALVRLLSLAKSAERCQVVAATASRCRESVRSARASLTRAANLVTIRGGNELVAVELRAALEQIGGVVGAIYTNDLLDRIFGTFCIGK